MRMGVSNDRLVAHTLLPQLRDLGVVAATVRWPEASEGMRRKQSSKGSEGEREDSLVRGPAPSPPWTCAFMLHEDVPAVLMSLCPLPPYPNPPTQPPNPTPIPVFIPPSLSLVSFPPCPRLSSCTAGRSSSTTTTRPTGTTLTRVPRRWRRCPSSVSSVEPHTAWMRSTPLTRFSRRAVDVNRERRHSVVGRLCRAQADHPELERRDARAVRTASMSGQPLGSL